MTCKREARVVTLLVAVCEQALKELDPADARLAPLVGQLERTRAEALEARRTVGSCGDARAA